MFKGISSNNFVIKMSQINNKYCGELDNYDGIYREISIIRYLYLNRNPNQSNPTPHRYIKLCCTLQTTNNRKLRFFT